MTWRYLIGPLLWVTVSIHVVSAEYVDLPCKAAMGMETGQIKDQQISASSYHSKSLNPQNSRLNGDRSWSAKMNGKDQWIQVDFMQTAKITQVATQGRADAYQWVTSYRLEYSRDFIVWQSYATEFKGNDDRSTVQTNDVDPAIIARFVRIHPTKWQSYLSLRAEFFGCRSGFYVPREDCAAPLGMTDHSIADSSITASSSSGGSTLPSQGRLYNRKTSSFTGAWLAKYNDMEQYFQIDLKTMTKITRVATQGRPDSNQWVKSYRLEYSYNDAYYQPYSDGKSMPGNTNRDDVHVNILEPVIITRYIRVCPMLYQSHIAMRVEMYGCHEGFQVPDFPQCQSKIDMKDSQMTASSQHSTSSKPQHARLYTQAGGYGAWMASVNDGFQFLQFDLGQVTKVTRVSTQGRRGASQWVTKYSLEYSLDDAIFTPHNDVNNKLKVFDGNKNYYDVVSHVITPAIIAHFIRIRPQSWSGHIAMRAEFYGCTEGFDKPNIPECMSPMGLRTGQIPDSKITASSEYNSAYRAGNGRLYFYKQNGRFSTWLAKQNDDKQWLQVDFSNIIKITRVATQGTPDSDWWVKTYSLEFSRDGIFWEFYQQGASIAELNGNDDRHTVVLHELVTPIFARYVRTRPKTWQTRISLREELYGCKEGFVVPKENCTTALGLENKNIPDSGLTASSEWNKYFTAARARLNINKQGSLFGAWSTKTNDGSQWLQVNLGNITMVTRIATQGRQDHNQWVTSYTLSSNLRQGHYFTPYNDHEVLEGNKDRNTIVGHILKPTIFALLLRVHPHSWLGHISMRMELYGCTKGFVVPTPPECNSAIVLPDERITASSEATSAHRASNGRLHHLAGNGRTGAWSAGSNDQYQYLEFQFSHPTKVTRVATQGRQDSAQWVKSYTIEYSLDGALYTVFKQNRKTHIFTGNTDQHHIVSHVIIPAVIARFIRIHPQTWHSHISLRAEFYGCTDGFEPPAEPKCVKQLGCQCLSIKDSQFSASSEYSVTLKAGNARLHLVPRDGRGGGWAAKNNDNKQWLQLDFDSYKTVTRIATQGRQDANQWVTSYSVKYSQDGSVFSPYQHNGKDVIFTGNRDRGSVVLHSFDPPITNVRMLRLLPLTWHSHISLRLEFYGCPGEIPHLAKPCDKSMDIGIALDRSTSVGPRHFNIAKTFLKILVERMKISTNGSHFGLIAYSSSASRVISFRFSQKAADINRQIDAIEFTGGKTRTDFALQVAITDLFTNSAGDRENVTDVLIVMTNGRTSQGSLPYKDVMKPLKEKKVDVIAVGIGPDVNEAELLEIAEGSLDHVIRVDDYEALATKLNSILALSCPSGQ
ncbi:uncharacterized protein LOC5503440 [Nematostella vectensis]|uniref:uncharacterized protein LOC5503440 n=1 Tax=Nematostella vectensis TaxID=45351 RepID=UPI0020773C64|nr:uncharacterized protein LOC5503440 [Nematostella vectensis]